MLYLRCMEPLVCPICNEKVDEILIPLNGKTPRNCLLLCENEYITHAICTNGTKLLFRNTTSMVEELKKAHNNTPTMKRVYA